MHAGGRHGIAFCMALGDEGGRSRMGGGPFLLIYDCMKRKEIQVLLLPSRQHSQSGVPP